MPAVMPFDVMSNNCKSSQLIVRVMLCIRMRKSSAHENPDPSLTRRSEIYDLKTRREDNRIFGEPILHWIERCSGAVVPDSYLPS